MLNRGLDKLELLRIVEAVANEKSIDKELVIGSMESAIQKAALTKFGNDNNIEVVIDRESGDIKIQKVLDIVEKVEDSAREITLDEAKKNQPENKVEEVEKIIERNFNLSPRGIREMLKLNTPIYEITSSYGHFGRKPSNKGHFTWEKTDKIDLFKL